MPLYIYHSSSATPVKTITLTKNTANSFEWSAQNDLVLSNYSYGPSGYWIIAYNQNDLQNIDSQAIKMPVNLNQACATCKAGIYPWKIYRRSSIFGR